MQFAMKLRQLMIERKLTQSALAARIWGRFVNSAGKNDARGKDRISVWLNGHNVPSEKNLALLAKALGVEASELAMTNRGRATWSRDRLAAWMHDHALDGEEPYV